MIEYHCPQGPVEAKLTVLPYPVKVARMLPSNDPPAHDPVEVPAVRLADLLLLLPFVWQLGLAPWANGIAWRALGLPFAMAWQMAGILFATAVLALRYGLDRRETGA